MFLDTVQPLRDPKQARSWLEDADKPCISHRRCSGVGPEHGATKYTTSLDGRRVLWLILALRTGFHHGKCNGRSLGNPGTAIEL
jgi:hypothetical protein